MKGEQLGLLGYTPPPTLEQVCPKPEPPKRQPQRLAVAPAPFAGWDPLGLFYGAHLPVMRYAQNAAAMALLHDQSTYSLAQMPTGSGKTLVGTLLACAARHSGFRVVITAPSAELVGMWGKKVCAATIKHRAGLTIDAGAWPLHSPFHVTTNAAFWRRVLERRSLPAFADWAGQYVVLVDEAHHQHADTVANFKALEGFGMVRGLTASPWTPDLLEHFNRAYCLTLDDAAQVQPDGTPPVVIMPEVQYEPNPLAALPAQGRWVVYVKERAEAQALAQSLPDAVAVSDPEPGYDFRPALTAWESGRFRVAVSAGRMREGYDPPADLAGIIVTGHVRSPISAYQLLGRCTRANGSGPRTAIFTPMSAPALQEGLALANGARVVCAKCESNTHLTVHCTTGKR